MNESGFAVGESQSSRALVNVREKSSWKIISGRQEWITAIECVNAAGEAIPPLLIYKAKYTNTA
jgi:nitrate reductase alpha subunit